MEDTRLISVIVATKNEGTNILNCLESIRAQAYPQNKIEVIVVDNNSTDKTPEIAHRYTSNVYNFGPERSAQRNFGVRKALGKYILYLDADMMLSENVIRECADKCEREGYVALHIPEKITDVCQNCRKNKDGQRFDLNSRNFWIKIRNFERSFYDGTVIDCVRFVRKEEFCKIGGFDENLTGPEDWDFDRRIRGQGKVDVTESFLYHNEGGFNLKQYLRKKSYYSKNFKIYIQKWGKDDKIINKQLGFWYRFWGVFVEDNKWKKLVRHPFLALGMYFLRLAVGIRYLMGKTK